jgi:membrane protein
MSTTSDTAEQPQRSRWISESLRGLAFADYKAVVKDVVRQAQKDHLSNLAQAVAYNAFIAIPAALLVGLSIFTLVADAQTIQSLLDKLSGVLPQDAIRLIGDSLNRQVDNQSSSVVLLVIGILVALWGLSGAVMTMIWALNTAYEVDETRPFVRLRMIALVIIVALVAAVALVGGLLILGPVISDWVGRSLGIEALTGWLWWVVQWPILLVGLSAVFAVVLWIGPNVEHPRFVLITPGTAVAIVIWLASSAGFALYTSTLASYNKAWGSLAGVIVMLTWLWLSSLALLLGGEVTAELEKRATPNPAGKGGQFVPGEAGEHVDDARGSVTTRGTT